MTDGQIEAGSLGHDVGVLLELRIAPKHITVLATLALFVAAVPQVPHLIHASYNGILLRSYHFTEFIFPDDFGSSLSFQHQDFLTISIDLELV